jgi:uncharacterized lipoprotein YddW (UPF0748 family)
LHPHRTQNYDPLRYVIGKAHELGIEVHPWFTLVLRWNHSFMPEYGLEGVSEGPQAAFDVHNPSFRQFMTQVVLEVATNYDIDGINLDYGRAMGLCSSPACEQEYQSLYHRNLALDLLAFKLAPKQVPTIIQYQEVAVTGLIQSISDSIKNVKPSILVSADGHPDLVRYEQGQNTVDWVNRGLVDVIFKMDYQPKINMTSIDEVRGRINDPNSLTLLISNMSIGSDLPTSKKPQARSGQWLANTISTIQRRWPETGVAVYFYKYLTDEQIVALKTGPFGERRNNVAPQVPTGLQVR